MIDSPNYRSLTPGGFFSADPNNLEVKRSIRPNNPGALNIAQWQRRFKGFVGVTQPDHAGNVTAIYVTPEHGIAAWYHLFTRVYHWGETGRFTMLRLAQSYAGVPDPESSAVKAYLRGWKRWSGNLLVAETEVSLADDAQLTLLAKAMFSHEIGAASPILPEQVVTALSLKRAGTLPEV